MPTCRDITDLLIAEPDAALPPAELARIEAHVATCEACRRQRALLAAVPGLLREATTALATPDKDEAWGEVRARIRQADPERRRIAPRARYYAWGVSVAAAAVVAFAVLLTLRWSDAPATALVAQAEFVQSDGSGSTLVYVDQESGWLIVWADSPPPAGTI